MQHVKVRDQGSLSNCYSFTAAEMIDAYRFSHPAPKGDRDYDHVTAAVEAAVGARDRAGVFKSAAKVADLDPIAIGDACKVADYIKDKGSCDDWNYLYMRKERTRTWDDYYMAQDDIDHHGAADGTNKKLLEALVKFYNDPDRATRAESELNDMKLDHRGALMCDLSEAQVLTPEMIASFLPADELERSLHGGDEMAFIDSVLGRGCREHRKPIDQKMSCKMGVGVMSTTAQRKEFMLRWFDQAKAPIQPLSISYCSAILNNAPGRYYKTPVAFVTPSCGGHVSAVIGKKWDAKRGRCEILVRNSWGKNCGAYWRATPPTVSADQQAVFCEKTCARYAADGENCLTPEDERPTGNVWVDADELAKNTLYVEHLE